MGEVTVAEMKSMEEQFRQESAVLLNEYAKQNNYLSIHSLLVP